MPEAMVKLVYCVRKRDDLSTEEFSRYWLDEHGPLVRSVRDRFPMARYVQSHTVQGPATDLVRASRGGAEPFDGITEVWVRRDDLEHGFGESAGEADALLREDEARFIDLERSVVFFTEEHEIFGPDGS